MSDELKDKCGVFGVFNHPDAAYLTYLGLYALQHRGEESAGIVVTDGKKMASHRDMGHVQEVFDGFIRETKGELWDNAEEMLDFYSQDKNYEALVRGEMGGNVIYKYKSMSLAFAADAWIDFLHDICKDIAHQKLDAEGFAKAQEELGLLRQFVKYKLMGVLNHKGDLTDKSMECNVDILAWLNSPVGTALVNFVVPEPVRYDFTFTQEQLAVRKDQFARYGTHVNAISKIVTRCSTITSLFRTITTSQSKFSESQKTEHDDFIRYTLSH